MGHCYFESFHSKLSRSPPFSIKRKNPFTFLNLNVILEFQIYFILSYVIILFPHSCYYSIFMELPIPQCVQYNTLITFFIFCVYSLFACFL